VTGAVVVATPTVLHAPIALAAVAAGKHLLVEKQLAMSYAEAQRMYQAAEAAGVRHMTAFTYRFVPAMRYLRHLLGQGTIGLPRHVRVSRLQDWPEVSIGWRQHRALAGSGEVGDMGAHRIDFCHDLIGPISSVTGTTRTFVPERRGAAGGRRARRDGGRLRITLWHQSPWPLCADWSIIGCAAEHSLQPHCDAR